MAGIVWADPAIHDLDAIADYIALDKPAAAKALVRKVVSAIEMLQRFPEMGSRPKELRGLPYRQIIVPPYRLFYRVEKKIVYIIHIHRGEQMVPREMFSDQSQNVVETLKSGSTNRKKSRMSK